MKEVVVDIVMYLLVGLALWLTFLIFVKPRKKR